MNDLVDTDDATTALASTDDVAIAVEKAGKAACRAGKRAIKSALVAILLLSCLAPLIATAECGTGKVQSYGDITAVLLTDRYRPGKIVTASPVTDLGASTFWLFFWRDSGLGIDDPPAYSQYNLVGEVGAFHVKTSMTAIRDILERDKFFSLSPPQVKSVHPSLFVLTVVRCAVVTRIWMQNDEDSATAKLFSDINALISGSEKIKVSDHPVPFEYNLLFDP